MRFLHFLQYHNAVPIAFGLLFLGAGGAFAATNPQAIYSATDTVVSIDNTYIANKDLSAWTPRVQITGVTEDNANYYIAYMFSTIDLADAVWKDVQKEETMTVSKADLGPYRDLGLYVTEQLKQKIDRELARLKETQQIEKNQVSQKVVATTYGGLIGKMLDDKTETLPGYTPVVTPPVESHGEVAAVAAATPASDAVQGSGGTAAVANASGILQMLGRNPSYVPVGSTYVDLGVVIVDSQYAQYGVHAFVNGKEMQGVSISTATTSEFSIRYSVLAGMQYVGDIIRRVIVYDPAHPPTFEPDQNVAVPLVPTQPAQNTVPAPSIQSTTQTPASALATSTAADTATQSTSTTPSASAATNSATTNSPTEATTTAPTSSAATSTAPVPEATSTSAMVYAAPSSAPATTTSSVRPTAQATTTDATTTP